MSLPLIAIRPEPGCSATVERGRKAGLAIEPWPLFEVRPPAQNQPSLAGVRHRPGLVTLGGLGLVAIAAAVGIFRQSTPPGPVPAEMRLEITTPPTTDPVSLALSPDGEKIVFVDFCDGVVWGDVVATMDRVRSLAGDRGHNDIKVALKKKDKKADIAADPTRRNPCE